MFESKFAARMAAMASIAAAGMLLAAGVPMEAQAAQMFSAQMERPSGTDGMAPVVKVQLDDSVEIPEDATLKFVEIGPDDKDYSAASSAMAGVAKDGFMLYDIYFQGKDGSQLVKQVPADITIDMPYSGYIDATRDVALYGVSLDGQVSEQGLLGVTEASDMEGNVYASSFTFHTEDFSDVEAVVGNHKTGWVSVRNDGSKDIALKLSLEAPEGSPDAYALYFDGERSDSQAADGSILVLKGGQKAVIQGLPADAKATFSYAGVPEDKQAVGDHPTTYQADVKGAYDTMVAFTGSELADNGLEEYDTISRDTMGVISDGGVGEGSPSDAQGPEENPDGDQGGQDVTNPPAGDGTDQDMLKPGDGDKDKDQGGQVTYDSPVNVEKPDDKTGQPNDDMLQVTDDKKDIAPKTGDSAKGLIPAVIALAAAAAAGVGAVVLGKKKKGQ